MATTKSTWTCHKEYRTGLSVQISPKPYPEKEKV